jgi:hypothetical protein
MNGSHLLPADLSKEIRALAPLWLGCAAIVWAGGLGDPFLFRAGFLSYLVGSAALGALSIGHEYTNRTLPLLLSVPVSRRRMFAIKASVLIAMLLSLSAIAVARLPVTPVGRELKDTALVGTLTLLSSVFLAPWLTMACRNVIAGAIFSLCIPAAVLVASELLAYGVTGQIDSQRFQSFRMQVLWAAMMVLSSVAAVSSWRSFMRLETIDGARSEFRLPRSSGRAVAREESRRRSPMSSLVRKELHLQQMTPVLSALYVTGWLATLVVRWWVGSDIKDALLILTVVNGVVVALLSGSLASAEERHLGMLESQVLMPMSTARQWAVKVAVVFGVCVLLTMALPAMLIFASEGAAAVRINVPFIVMTILLPAVGLYSSSVSSGGVKALLIAGPIALSLLMLIPLLGDVVLWAGRSVRINPGGDAFGLRTGAIIGVTVFSLLIGFGLMNHRTSDRSPVRIWRQVLWLCGSVVGIMLIALIAR